MTSFSILGPKTGQEAHHRWQVVTSASWTASEELQGIGQHQAIPTLAALPLRKNGQPEVVLAVGELEGVILSPKGSHVTTFPLPAPASAPVLYVDFSGDALNDLIVTTSDGIYGFVQTRQPGAILFSTLVGILLLVMGVIFITQHLGSSKGNSRPAGRQSTTTVI